MDWEEFKRKLTPTDLIKTYFYRQNAIRWILQEAKNIDNITYKDVRHRLKTLRYQFLQNFGTIAGDYSPEKHKISIYGKSNIMQSTILHEILHGCSNNEGRFSPFNKNNTATGLMGKYNTFMSDKSANCFLEVNFGTAINEAATEFFTCDILSSKNKKYKADSVYTPLVNLFAIFCMQERDGEIVLNKNIKQKLFKFYVNAKLDDFVDYLSNTYHSPKSQVYLLLYELDKVLEVERNSLLSFDMLIRSYNTLYEMQYNRFVARHQNGTLNDFLNSIEVKEMTNLFPSKVSFEANNIAKSMFIKKFKNIQKDIVDTNNLADFILNFCFDKKINYYDLKANSFTDSAILNNSEKFDNEYRKQIKKFNDYEKLSALLFLSSPKYLKPKDNLLIHESAIVEDIIINGKPKNKDYKNDFMFYILNIPGLKKEYYYYLFSPDEIMDYIKNDKARYKVNVDNIQKSLDIKHYLKNSKTYSEVFDNKNDVLTIEKTK